MTSPPSQPRTDRRVWLRLVARVRPHRGTLALAVLASLVAAGAASVWASLVGPLAQGVVKGGEVTWGPFVLAREDLVFRLPLAIVGVALVKGLGGWLHAGWMARVAQGVLGTLRRDLYGRLLSLPPGWFEQRHSGELLSRFTSDVAQVEFSVSQALSTLAKDTLQILGLLTVCLVIDWRLFLVVFVVLPGTILPVSRFSKAAKRTATKGQASLGALSMLTAEQLHNLPVVQGYRLEGAALEQFDAEQDRYLGVMKRSLFIRGAFSPTTEFLGLIGVAAAVVLGARAVLAEPALAGRLVSFLAAALLLYQPLKALSHTAQQVSQGAGAAARLFEVLDAVPEPDAGAEARPLSSCLKLEGVRLTWPDGREALQGVDFEVGAGEMVALVGPSGAGKSSVLAVLLGFVRPSQGEVKWDGASLSSLSRRSVRAHLAWVPQEPVLLSGTVRDNLKLGKAGADDAALWQALTRAHAADFVKALPKGLDEEVGERGARLSGGQRQRLAIARAFLVEPSLLLLDEPTSALDAATEAEVQAGLAELMVGRTTLVVAHRLSTVRRAQRIVVLKDGVVAESGTHEALVAKGGVYARLLQAAHGDALA
ncbi:MAG: ABC transporter ATP-binding protein [Myxococcales bacterium]|nr:ABC transporter ATP-binding protein [Myxococcales bacterium]